MSGKGRGRGWLKLDKPQENVPGVMPDQSTGVVLDVHSMTSTKYKNIVKGILQFSENDDGIMLNRKYKYVTDLMKDECQSPADVKNMFDAMYNVALQDTEYASKFVIFMSLNSIKDLKVCDQQFRFFLIEAMEEEFERRHDALQNNRRLFHNSIRILGGYYERARCGSTFNKYYKFFAEPVQEYYKMLVDSGMADDIELLAKQLNANGEKLLNTVPEDLWNIIVKVRNLLTGNKHLDSITKTWLLYVVDLHACKYNKLPLDLSNYYETKLGEITISGLQKDFGVLNIKTALNTSLEGYTSDVNVLQLDTSTSVVKTPVINQQQQRPPNQINHTKKSPNLNVHKTKDESTFGTWNESNNKKSQGTKTGRPILGVGARLQKDMPWQNNSKDSGSVGDIEHKNSDRIGRSTKSRNKGWEHDDRFENDYN